MEVFVVVGNIIFTYAEAQLLSSFLADRANSCSYSEVHIIILK